jgi:exosortase A
MLSYYQSYKVYLQLMLLIIAIPLVFWADSETFVNAWKNNTTYNHGFFILPIALWLLYRQRYSISSTATTPEPRVLIVLALALLLWFLSDVASVNVTQQFALIALIPISIWVVFGRELLMKIIFPIAFLFFMIPVGASLVPPLMEITADITVSMIELTGIPVYRDGLYFTLPTGNWSVVEACSGLNYLVASLTLGVLYSYLTYRSLTKRLLFVLVITLFALIANGLRAYGIVIIGHLSEMQYGTGGDHEFYGWLF